MIACRPVVRQRLIQTSSVSSMHVGRGVEGLVGDQVRAGMDRLDGRPGNDRRSATARRARGCRRRCRVGKLAAHTATSCSRENGPSRRPRRSLDRCRRARPRSSAACAAECATPTAGGSAARAEITRERSPARRNEAAARAPAAARNSRRCLIVKWRASRRHDEIPFTSSPWTSVRRKSRPA